MNFHLVYQCQIRLVMEQMSVHEIDNPETPMLYFHYVI